MRRLLPLLFVPLLFAADEKKPNTLTPEEAAKGALLLFDGETTFGWKIDGEAKVEKGVLVIGGEKEATAETTTWLPPTGVEMKTAWEGKAPPGFVMSGLTATLTDSTRGKFFNQKVSMSSFGVPDQPLVRFTVPAGSRLMLMDVKFKPVVRKELFDGKSLGGWMLFTGDPKREKSKFTAEAGVLTVKDGPGDLATEKHYDDFVLQFECKSNGKHLNSGLFFRAIPGKYQDGYEAQIQHDFSLETPKKYAVDEYDPATHKLLGKKEVLSSAKDFGTGAIYRRIPARKAMAKDGEWFTMTVVARGRHIATWVNGVQQVDWTDNRAAHENPRNGYRAEAGAISIQGHDPTTDLSFRNLRVAPLAREKK